MGPIQGRAPADTEARVVIRMKTSANHPEWLKAEREDGISRRYFKAVISGVNEAALS
mgnify:CR=1 FL=1